MQRYCTNMRYSYTADIDLDTGWYSHALLFLYVPPVLLYIHVWSTFYSVDFALLSTFRETRSKLAR